MAPCMIPVAIATLRQRTMPLLTPQVWQSLGHCHTSHRSGPEASEMEKIQKKSCYCRLTCLNHLNHDKYHDKTLTPAMCNKGTSERPGVQQNTKKTPPKTSIKRTRCQHSWTIIYIPFRRFFFILDFYGILRPKLV